jgi:very-short-patch-repair endonuclease
MTVAVEIDADARLHFALQQLRVPVVKHVRVRNDGPQDLAGVDLHVALPGVQQVPWHARIENLRAGAAHSFADLELGLDVDALRAQSERAATVLRVTAQAGDVTLACAEQTIELFPLRHWPGLASLPELLAAFVLPHDPAVADVLARAGVHLRTATGNGTFDGYQNRDPARVRAMAAAVHDTVRDLGIAGEDQAVDFAAHGQRVRLPDALVRDRQATALELALLYAAALELAGLHPLLIVCAEHALAGVWLSQDTFPAAALEDGLKLRKRVDLDEICVVDPVLATRAAAADFAAATAAAKRQLVDLANFRTLVDVARARRLGVQPVPVIAAAAPGAAPPPLGDNKAPSHTPQPEPGTPAPVRPPESPATRLERWQRKLLDLSLRNRLINFKPTKLALRLVHDDITRLEDALAGGADFELRPAPERARADTRPAAPPAAAEAARRAAFFADELGQRRIYTDLAMDELDLRLVELWRHVKVAREESGANVLFLALGSLRYYETPSSHEPRQAPLLLIPIEIERVSAREGFRLRLGEEDARINVTLLEKLAVDFQLRVAGLDELSEDDSGLDVRAVLQRFRRAVRDVDRWDVVEDVWLAPFSFAKFLMWRDLQEQKDALLLSPVVRHLVEQPGRAFAPDASFPDPAQLDAEQAPRATFLPLDADSSQLAAVLAAAKGRSFVLEGPPGTGKSQTIANLIAQCLATGKRVLFVAEKMAALEVVHQRLAKVGLAPFCLELHSKESSKRAVLDSMQDALDLALEREPEEWDAVTSQLAQARDVLNGYVRVAHAPGSYGESVFQATAALIGLRHAPRVPLVLAAPLLPNGMDRAWLEARREVLDAVRAAAADVGDLATHPLRAVRRSRWETALPERTSALCADAVAKLGLLQQASAGLAAALTVDARQLAPDAFAAALALARDVMHAPGAADALLTAPGFDDLRPRLLAAVEAVRQRDQLRARVREAFTDSVLARDLDGLVAQLRTAMASVWPLSWWRARRVRNMLAAHANGGHLGANADIAHRLTDAIDLRGRTQGLAAADHVGATTFGARLWQGGDPGVDGVKRLAQTIEWAGNVRKNLRTLQDALGDDEFARVRARVVALAGPESDALTLGARTGDQLRAFVAAADAFAGARQTLVDLLELDAGVAFTPLAGTPFLTHQEAILRGLASSTDDLAVWCHWRRTRAQAEALDLTPLLLALEAGTLAPPALRDTFERAFREVWLAAICDADPILRDFAGREHERRIERFAELDRRVLALTQRLLVARLGARVPRGTSEPAASSEVGILLRELAKKTRHKPLRRLFAEIPNLLPRLKPCFLMSPLSVAQYLAAGGAPFDLVVFDEASQITVSDAVGALARGRSAVVVGDSKQLPPTTFFQRLEEGEDDLDDLAVEELESILDECRSAGLPALRLAWHYRSQHESLIAFSNYHYYDNALLTFPAAQEKVPHLGVSMVHVAGGVYDRSKSRTNRKEAESVVADLLARLRVPGAPPDQPSVGIVTFSQAQQTLVETLLDEARRQDPSLEPYFGDAVPEPVFVKNLENVQGDERDVILFSICYGPDAQGKVAMAFGPLNNAGGERRLNVAITRARRQVVVHATLQPDQIDLARSNALGVKHLKYFLDYGARGPRALAEAHCVDAAARAATAFETDVGTALRAAGHDVAAQVGCSGYRVDLAVRDPDRPGCFMLGVECDGAFYHGSLTARDRDRLRQAVLTRLGWRLVRVWASDWWRSPARELARLQQHLAQARQTKGQTQSTGESAAAKPADPAIPADAPAAMSPRAEPSTPPAAAGADTVVYEPLPVDRARGTFEAATDAALGEVIAAVIAAEAPLHSDLLARRVGAFFALTRVTARVRARVLQVALHLPAAHRPQARGEFIWPHGIDPQTWTALRVPDPARAPTYRDAEHIPPEEIANAAVHVVRAQVGLAREDLLRETATLLGFARAGARVRSAVAAGLTLAQERGLLVESNGHMTAGDRR